MIEENIENKKKKELLTKWKIENDKEKKIDTQKLEEINDRDNFKGHTSSSKFKLFCLFIAAGKINHLGTILVMTGGLLAYSLKMYDYVPIYVSASILFSFKLCLIIILFILFFLLYFFFIRIKLCFWRICYNCIFKIFKFISKNFNRGWSCGTRVSGIIGSLLNFLSQLNKGFSLKYLYLILIPVRPLCLFLWINFQNI